MKRALFTFVIVFIALCALVGVSYFAGWLFIEQNDIKTENVNLTGVRVFFGFILASIMYSGVRIIDFIQWVWNESTE